MTTLAKPKSYFGRLWSQAATETWKFWNSYRIITAIASPIVTAIFWVIIKGWTGWREMLYAALLGILIFLTGWGIVFVVGFLRAPAALDAQSQRTIADLSQQLELPDKVLAEHLGQLLTGVGDNGRELLKFILLYDEVPRDQVKLGSVSSEETNKTISECADAGLINRRIEVYGSGAISLGFYSVPEGFRPTLKRMLYR